MNLQEYLSQLAEWPKICERFGKWIRFMEENVVFSLAESPIHTKAHCARVLLYTLVIAEQLHLPAQDLDALGMAAIFHDTRRQDDWLDVGHGQRAADYYRESCAASSLSYDKRTYFIIAYHDQDDKLGLRVLQEQFADDSRAALLYQIFKDADALDRFRLGSNALDVKYLRTDQAGAMVDFARDTLEFGAELLKVCL